MAGLIHRYFVLDPRLYKDGTDAHAKASRTAMVAYAGAIRESDPRLSRELREWVDAEWQKDNKRAELMEGVTRQTGLKLSSTEFPPDPDDIPIT